MDKKNEIAITRVYDAPVQTVWEAWTDPAQAAQWWGPRGFTITTHEKDLKPGGVWHYTMHGPDGVDYPNKTVYLEVETLKKLVYDHGGNDERAPLFRVTVLFSEANGKTKMDMRMTLPTPEAAEETRGFIRKANGNSTWDRLAEYLEKTSSGKDTFVINRSFDAPIALVFEMWTDPKHLARWVAPSGFEMHFFTSNITPGGKTFSVMTNNKDVKMYGRAEYLEVRRPDRIVYTQQFCDEHENITRHPLAPTWPETMLTIVTLAEEAPSRTRVTIIWEPYGKVTTDELRTFVQAKTGMMQGWTGSLDKLEAHLSNH